MTHVILILNTQAAGDAILGTHLARLLKEQHPDSKIIFGISAGLTLTTAENDPRGIHEVLEIIELQEGIDTVAVLDNDRLHIKNPVGEPSTVIIQNAWYGDQGIARSQLLPALSHFPIITLHTETRFNVGQKKVLPDKPKIAIAGELDWNRKWGNPGELNIFLAFMLGNTVYWDIEFIGRDCHKLSYLEQLKLLNNCHLLVSPMGSLVHLAAGLGLDTISLTSVFPKEYDCPEYYHTGYHKSIKQLDPKLHCQTYQCVTPKNYNPRKESWGNPPTSMGFWTKTCPYTSNGKSCIYNATGNMLSEAVMEWMNDRDSTV